MHFFALGFVFAVLVEVHEETPAVVGAFVLLVDTLHTPLHTPHCCAMEGFCWKTLYP